MEQTFSKLIAVLVILLNSQIAFAKKGPNYPEGFTPRATNGIIFTENKGQVYDQNYNPRPDVLFGAMACNMAFHLKTNGVSYQLYRIDKYKEVIDESTPAGLIVSEKRKEIDQQTIYRVDLNWVNANKNFTTTTDQTVKGCNNYYLESCPNGALNVKSYTGVTIHNLYNGINLHYYERQGQLKHDYIVAPNTDYKQIQIKVDGATINANKDGSLLLTTPLGKIQEGAPIVYQNGKTLKAKWKVNNNTLSFEIENYDANQELIIDPVTRLWGTYYGGTGTDAGYSCATDATGNVYLAGQTTSNTGTVMATAGAHQTTLGGGTWDAFIVKFDNAGIRQWGTYYGGTGSDRGFFCATDAAGNVYLTGWTDSNIGTVIATVGAHQTVFGGGSNDAFLVKFNSSGVRQWGTYYGGTTNDQGLSCATDATGNVYLTGPTTSNSGTVIATVGAHQSVYGGGAYDAFLVMFNSSGVRQWGTYYGGNGDDRGYSCVIDATGNVHLAGFTTSNAGTIIATAGAHQTVNGSGNDAFLVQFSSSGVRQWGTYYGGAGTDVGRSCAIDATGNVYLAGYTDSNTGTVIATTGAHQAVYGGGSNDAYLVKFNSVGVRQWGTYYGGSGADVGYSCAFNTAGNLYLSGHTQSGTGTVIATVGTHQTALGGAYDAFLVSINSNGIRQWGTYYGGTGTEEGFFCASDATGNVYMSGHTDSNTGTVIATAGAHQTGYSGAFDAFLVKFSDCIVAPSQPGAISGNITICSGSNNTYSVAPVSGVDFYTWSLPSGWTGSSSTNIINTASSAISGIITVSASNACGASSPQTLSVTVNTAPSTPGSISGTTSLCSSAGPTTYSIAIVAGATSYTWILPGGWSGTSATNSIAATPGSSGIFTVTANNSCGASPQQTLNVTVNLLPTITVNSGSICTGNSFTIVPSGANTYTIQGGSNIVSPIINTSYTVVGTSAAGCVSNTFATSNVTVNVTPTITIIGGVICPGNSFTLNPSGANSYTFSSGPVVSPTVTTSYSVTGTSTAGCVSNGSAVATITVANTLTVTITGSNTVCNGNSVSLTAGGATSYTWNTGATTTTISPTPSVNTTYSVIGASGSCSNTSMLTVTVNPLPTINVSTNNTLICVGQSATITANGASTYTWNPGGTGTIITISPTISTNYTITGTDANGCTSIFVFAQNVSPCTGIDQPVLSGVEESLNIYPNPFCNKITLVTTCQKQIVQIYNTLGSIIYSEIIVNEKTEIDLSNQLSGIYFIRIGIITKKLIKE